MTSDIHPYLVHECTINWMLYIYIYMLYNIRDHIKDTWIVPSELITYHLIHFVQSNFRKEFFAWIRKKKILPLRATRYLFPCYIRVLRRARIKRHFAIRDRTFHIRNRKKVEGRSIEMLEVKYWKFDRTTELSPRNDTHFSAF